MKNKKLIIIVLILLVVIGGIFYFSRASEANCGPTSIKGNISSTGEKIYHVPGGQYYDKTTIDKSLGERCFSSEKEAISAGWRASLR